MAFLLIDGVFALVDAIDAAVEADALANTASAAADGLSNVNFGAIPEGLSAIAATGATVGLVGKTMGQTRGTGSGGLAGFDPLPVNGLDAGIRNVVYDPSQPPLGQVVYQPFVNSRGGALPSGEGYMGGYGGVWFGQRRGRLKNKKHK